jgi:hypothetical protein
MRDAKTRVTITFYGWRTFAKGPKLPEDIYAAPVRTTVCEMWEARRFLHEMAAWESAVVAYEPEFYPSRDAQKAGLKRARKERV